MATADIRQHTGYLFLAVIIGHMLLISEQVNARSGVPVLEAVTFGVLSEFQRSMTTAASSVRHVWTGYLDLRHVRRENDALKQRLAADEVALQEQRALADRARGLQSLLELKDHSEVATTAAEVIGAAANPDFRTVTIDKGRSDGLKADMAVIAPAGVVGRIVAPSVRSAKVQLLVDRNAAAGALIERSRAQGVVVGTGDAQLRLDYVSEVFDIVVGDTVVTSGVDGIYPKGFVIGRIAAIERSGSAYKQIMVKPAVDFSGIEEVLVVVTPHPAREARAGGKE